MSQSLISLRAARAEAERIFSILQNTFEDDGYTVAITEIDEEADIHSISIYVDIDEVLIADVKERIRQSLGSDGFGTQVTREDLPDIDWVAKSLEDLKPVRAGRFLIHGAHDRKSVKAGDVAIEIDAAQAFGTGHHGTTSGCLIMLETIIRKRKPYEALDLGTGSAVLAIAIAKLAQTRILATDIDPVAVDIARKNVALNGQADQIRCEISVGFKHIAFKQQAPFDLIVANILLWPLMAMALDIKTHLAHGGDVVLSGILTKQRNMVLAAFRNVGLTHRRTIEREGWVTIHLRQGNL